MHTQVEYEHPAKLIKFTHEKSKWYSTYIENQVQIFDPRGRKTKLINCIISESNEVILVLQSIILFFDEELEEIRSLELRDIDTCIQNVTCCATDFKNNGFLFSFGVTPGEAKARKCWYFFPGLQTEASTLKLEYWLVRCKLNY